ncbi:MAG: site-specific DNA-methyltransferase [Epsilonproteobacteria bacterium]|nr:MAG: site-specific DNA-methyltransferase [Campylobacterota bacterium]
MEKLNMKTPNFTDENIEKIAQIFPDCLTEKKDENGNLVKAIDFDLLKQELSSNIVEGNKERYSINWPGKKKAMLKANEPINKTLRPCVEESVNFDTTQNLYIEGDNLDALKLLQESYINKIKMIYIDPPYNTGNDFVYKDNFTKDVEDEYLEGGQKDEDGGRLVANLDSNGRYHSDWLSMMYPRLKLARNLLKDDGVIFISIDDNEVHNLRKICDDIFGENNFVTEFIWEKKKKPSFLHRNIGKLSEYILCYVKNTENTFPFSIDTTTIGKKYPLNNAGNSINKLIFPAKTIKFNMNDCEIEPQNMSEGNIITKLLTHLVVKNGLNENEFILEGEWRYSQIKINEIIKNNETIVISKIPFRPNHIKSGGEVKKMKNNFSPTHYKMETNEDATEQLIKLFGKEIFDTPKPLKLLKTLIKSVTYENKDNIILDFFSGSSTIAEAVISLNLDKGNRKFINIQVAENLDTSIQTATGKSKEVLTNAITFLNDIKKPRLITEIGKERIRRAGKKILEENKEKEGIEDLDIGFRVLKIDSSNMKDVYYTPDTLTQSQLPGLVENIKNDRSPEDLLFQVLLDWGVDLTLNITKDKINGQDVYFVDDNSLCACFDKGLSEEFIKELASISKEKDMMRVVFRDNGFDKDETKDNVVQIFKQQSPTTEVRSI